jgi:hypothetical protein
MSELHTNNPSDDDWVEPNFIPRVMLMGIFLLVPVLFGFWISFCYIAIYLFKYYANYITRLAFGNKWIYFEILVFIVSVSPILISNSTPS